MWKNIEGILLRCIDIKHSQGIDEKCHQSECRVHFMAKTNT